MSAAAATATRKLLRLQPLLDRVLVQRFAPEVKTKGGIMLPAAHDKSSKVTTGTVIATGPGARTTTSSSSLIPVSVSVGDRVLLPEYGGQKVMIEDEEYYLFRDSDILAKWCGDADDHHAGAGGK